MKQPIQRYTQGFGGFGPLEKCNDGKLVKYEDHINEAHYIERILNGKIMNLESENIELKRKLKRSGRYFIIQSINVLVLLVTLGFSLWH